MEINSFCPECENGIFLYEMPRPGLLLCKRCGKGREASGDGELDARGAVQNAAFADARSFIAKRTSTPSLAFG